MIAYCEVSSAPDKRSFAFMGRTLSCIVSPLPLCCWIFNVAAVSFVVYLAPFLNHSESGSSIDEFFDSKNLFFFFYPPSLNLTRNVLLHFYVNSMWRDDALSRNHCPLSSTDSIIWCVDNAAQHAIYFSPNNPWNSEHFVSHVMSGYSLALVSVKTC